MTNSLRFWKITLPTLFLLTMLISACDFSQEEEPVSVPRIITVEIIITATPDPNATIPVQVITATLQPGQVVLPTEIAVEVATDQFEEELLATLTNESPVTEEADVASVTLNENCITHTIVEGDTPFGVALEYEVDFFELMTINGLTEETAALLQIGDELIIPLEGCPVLPPPSATPIPTETFTPTITRTPSNTPTVTNTPTITRTPTVTRTPSVTPSPVLSSTPTRTPSPTVSATPSVTPSLTLQPTSARAQIEIVEVLNVGDITAEAVRIRNLGNTVDVTGWTLSDLDGNVYTFDTRFVFSNSELTIFTRSGTDTAIALFWGLDTPVWGDNGEILTLRDADGRVQATARLGEE